LLGGSALPAQVAELVSLKSLQPAQSLFWFILPQLLTEEKG
jgi:hypothetical protein